MNALRWIAGFFGYLVVFALFSIGLSALIEWTDPHIASYLRVISILFIAFMLGGIVIGEVVSRYR